MTDQSQIEKIPNDLIISGYTTYVGLIAQKWDKGNKVFGERLDDIKDYKDPIIDFYSSYEQKFVQPKEEKFRKHNYIPFRKDRHVQISWYSDRDSNYISLVKDLSYIYRRVIFNYVIDTSSVSETKRRYVIADGYTYADFSYIPPE